jgi:hypothetical protein
LRQISEILSAHLVFTPKAEPICSGHRISSYIWARQSGKTDHGTTPHED